MKKIFISTPYPIVNDGDQTGVENFVKEELNIEIKIIPHEWDEDNQTGYFYVQDSLAIDVIEIVHEYGDAQCFWDEPKMEYDDEGRTMGWSNIIE